MTALFFFFGGEGGGGLEFGILKWNFHVIFPVYSNVNY